MTRLWMVRHGETDWNLQGRFQGQADTPLNARGLEQAHRLAGLFMDAGIQAIYSSDLQRAALTAQIIGERLDLPPKLDRDLREIRLGEWEGLQTEQIKSQYSDIWFRRQLDPVHVSPPGGENLLELAKRVCDSVNQITRQHPNSTVLLVSHGVSLACLICQARGLSLEQALQVIPDNAHPIQVDWS